MENGDLVFRQFVILKYNMGRSWSQYVWILVNNLKLLILFCEVASKGTYLYSLSGREGHLPNVGPLPGILLLQSSQTPPRHVTIATTCYHNYPNFDLLGNVFNQDCIGGSFRKGPKERVCQNNGTWTGQPISCHKCMKITAVFCNETILNYTNTISNNVLFSVLKVL